MRLPLTILAVFCTSFLCFVWGTASELPEKVAVHFGGNGVANGWMTKQEHLMFISGFGMALPLFLIAVFSLIRVLPSSLVNIPHRDYWLAPERKDETAGWLQRQGLLLACAMVLWTGALHFIIIQANAQQPPNLSFAPTFWLTSALIVYVIVFIVQMFRRFKKS